MKKLALSMIAALAIFSVSCSKSDKGGDSANDSTKTEKAEAGKAEAGDTKAQLKKIMDDAAAQIAANPADAEKILMDAQNKVMAIGNSISPEERATLDQDAELLSASENLRAVYDKARNTQGPAGDNDVEGVEEVEAVEAVAPAAPAN